MLWCRLALAASRRQPRRVVVARPGRGVEGDGRSEAQVAEGRLGVRDAVEDVDLTAEQMTSLAAYIAECRDGHGRLSCV